MDASQLPQRSTLKSLVDDEKEDNEEDRSEIG